jgi:hypothetical protein
VIHPAPDARHTWTKDHQQWQAPSPYLEPFHRHACHDAHGGTLIGGNPLAIVINGHEDGAPLAKD